MLYWMKRTLGGSFLIASLMMLSACGGGGGGGSLFEAGTGNARIELTAETYRLPVQTGTLVEPISPLYTTRIVAKAYTSDGSLLASGTPIQFATDSVTGVGALYPQPFEYEDAGNDTKVKKAVWNYSVNSANGQALMLFHAGNRTGTANISASFVDPKSNKTISKTISIDVVSTVATGMPANIYASITNSPIYVANQGKLDTTVIDIKVDDPSSQPVNDPGNANIKVELLNPEIGASLLGMGGQQGTIVSTRTTSGKAQVSLRAGNTPGTAKLRITADAADNNVENGIAQAIVDDISVRISDGRVAALVLTGPFAEAVRTNTTTLPLAPGESFQDGTYLRILSAVATDSLGNPVPGAEIKFSLIDSPIRGYPAGRASFVIAGDDGDPSEGGNLFTSNSGRFITNAVIRNDRLVLRPSEEGPDRLLAGSRIILQVNDDTHLLVNAPFSSNNGHDGRNIPWAIGRAKYGVIGASAITNSQGVATTFITYPVNRLNQPALITAEADNGIATVLEAAYLGNTNADFSITSSLTEVPAGATTDVTLCVKDANSTPAQANRIDVSGAPSSVTVTPSNLVTDASGCVVATINANNYTGTADVTLTFAASGTSASAPITIRSQGAGTLYITSVTSNADSATIQVSLIEEKTGTPISGRLITATGSATDDGTTPTANISSITSTGTTDSNGQATVTVNYSGGPGDTYTINITAQGGATQSRTIAHP